MWTKLAVAESLVSMDFDEYSNNNLIRVSLLAPTWVRLLRSIGLIKITKVFSQFLIKEAIHLYLQSHILLHFLITINDK